MSCMSGSPNLNSFRDRGQVAVQLVSCGVLLPGLVQDCTQRARVCVCVCVCIHIYIGCISSLIHILLKIIDIFCLHIFFC